MSDTPEPTEPTATPAPLQRGGSDDPQPRPPNFRDSTAKPYEGFFKARHLTSQMDSFKAFFFVSEAAPEHCESHEKPFEGSGETTRVGAFVESRQMKTPGSLVGEATQDVFKDFGFRHLGV